MAISNELSSEIAAAILVTKNKREGELNDLKETILKVHSTLQELAAKPRSDRTLSQAAGKDHDSHL